jgi:hypothetical protein
MKPSLQRKVSCRRTAMPGKGWILAWLCTMSAGVVFATGLNQVATQDLNGHGGSAVEKQATAYVEVKAYANSHAYNRKSLFLFDLSSFGGRDVRDQYLHTASFTVWAYDSQCDNFFFRLYGFTDTADNDDSRWDESLTDQAQANFPDRYWGAYQYPGGNGVTYLDTRSGPVKNASMVFGSNLVYYVRWGAGRNPGFGYSATNPDAKITLLLAREEYDNDISGVHSRQTEDGDSYKPRLTLDVRFPEIRVGISEQGDIANGGRYDFGVVPETNPVAVVRELAIDDQQGEALSSLHVASIAITGEHARCFTVVDTNFFLAQGNTFRSSILFNPGADLEWGIWDQAWLVIRNNDEDESTFRVNLQGEIFPRLRFLEVVPDEDPAAFVLQWASRTGLWYTVWTQTNLMGGGWSSNDSLRATGRIHTWTNADSAEPRYFFRVGQVP